MTDSVRDAVARGRRRVAGQLALREAFFGFAVALAGPALAILLGTDLFPAWMAAAVALGGVGWAAVRYRRALPSDYRVAQLLDARLHTEDQLSTALHFGERAGEQSRLAARAAESGDVAAVLPYHAPRTLYWAAGAAGLCVLLLAVRIGTDAGLDLRSPATPALTAALSEEEESAAEIADETPDEQADARRETAETGDARTTTEGLERAEAQPPVPPTPEEPFEMPEVEGLSMGDDFGDQVAPTEKGETAAGESGEGEESGADAEPPAPEDNDWSESSNNLLERLQEAFQNLMEQMGVEDAQQQQAGQSAEQESSGQESQEPGQETEQQAEGSGEPSEAEMEGGETASGEPQQTAQGQGDQNAEEPGGEGSASSSAGSGEGSKEIEIAAQQELAMDQLEEFYMERSEEMAGEIMVETSTAEQTAFTPFQPTDAEHADSGGAAARDEVPLAYRSFIENYFRNLRQNDPN